MFRMAYGTERHESYFEEAAAKARAGTSTAEEIRHLREELEAMHARGSLPPGLRDLLGELKALHEQTRPPAAGEGAR
jgi:hypothetical protein